MPSIPIQHSRIYSNFLPFYLCNFLLPSCWSNPFVSNMFLTAAAAPSTPLADILFLHLGLDNL